MRSVLDLKAADTLRVLTSPDYSRSICYKLRFIEDAKKPAYAPRGSASKKKIIVCNERHKRVMDNGITVFPVDEFLRELWSGGII
jgi:hypothetical protein